MKGSDFNSAAYLSKKLKAKGLQKLKFYCQVCLKQCRDENGFKSHIRSSAHLKNISSITESDIEKYTSQFEDDFLKLLRMSHGEKKIGANKFYNEFIQNRDHIHMNATKFTSLSKFLQHLGKSGKIRVYGSDNMTNELDVGLIMISYIDNSSKTMLRNEQLKQFAESQLSENMAKNKLLECQIQKGLEVAEQVPLTSEPQQSLSENVKVSLKFNNKIEKPLNIKKSKKTKLKASVFSKK